LTSSQPGEPPAVPNFAFVLDASAVIAYLNREPGRNIIEPVLAVSVISTINWGEVITWLSSSRNLAGADINEAREVLHRRGLSTTPLTEALAEVAGLLALQTQHAGLSLGDRAALALALELNLTILTADRSWDRVNVGASVRQIR
jgi:ribonuclease VapC